jgi:hypothetical protein
VTWTRNVSLAGSSGGDALTETGAISSTTAFSRTQRQQKKSVVVAGALDMKGDLWDDHTTKTITGVVVLSDNGASAKLFSLI